jgi:large subunit ribosomal protein L29
MKLKQIKEKLKELRGMTDAQVGDELLKLRREQFNLRIQAASGQGAKPDQHGAVRRQIARLKTVQRQRAQK